MLAVVYFDAFVTLNKRERAPSEEWAAEAVVLTATSPRPGEPAYTLSGEVKTTREVVDMVLSYFPDSLVTFDEGYPDPGLPGHLDGYTFRRDLGWEPRFTMADGIAHMVNFYR